MEVRRGRRVERGAYSVPPYYSMCTSRAEEPTVSDVSESGTDVSVLALVKPSSLPLEYLKEHFKNERNIDITELK